MRSQAGVAFADRGAANSNAGGKYRTLAEQRVAAAGGRTTDSGTVCFCLSWGDKVDLDLHCQMPGKAGKVCYFLEKHPHKNITLDVDKQAQHLGSQVENIFLSTAGCPDGNYEYFIRLYSGGRMGPKRAVGFTVVCNQLNEKIDEATATVKDQCPMKDHASSAPDYEKGDTHCLTLTLKKGKVTKSKFHIEAKSISLD